MPSLKRYGWDWMDGMVIKGQWSSKRTFGVDNKKLDPALPEGIIYNIIYNAWGDKWKAAPHPCQIQRQARCHWERYIIYDIKWYYMILYDMKYHIWYDVCMIWYIKGDLQYFDNGSFFESQTIIMVNKTLSLLSSSSSLSLNNYYITCPRGRWRRVRSCADRFLALCATLQDTACYNLFNCKFL